MTAATAAVLGYMIAAAALDTGFCHLFGSISIFNLLSSIISISFHYSTYLSSVFSLSFYYFEKIWKIWKKREVEL
jgi:hypothetical protein